MKQLKNEMLSSLSRKEVRNLMGGSMSRPEKEYDEKSFFEKYGIYQI